ncbi:MAG: DUF4350 domain-containing protein [Actinomycetaceae bacterium]|nr:DUF4350 domain-containing protein [Arcanobacterium sp.]MDD7505164.1 DUF4350 domain-containing protein [Actinomycetaceae bacterium]MDY6143846.1 DUF4350 domain-containing protein [Arcanobacterium sp.]
MVTSSAHANAPTQSAKPNRKKAFLWIAAVVLSLITATVIWVRVNSSNDGEAYSPYSAEPDGAGALAEILSDNGVRVHKVDSFNQLADVASDSTIVVVNPSAIDDPEGDVASLGVRTLVVEGTSRMWAQQWGFKGEFMDLSADEHEPEARSLSIDAYLGKTSTTRLLHTVDPVDTQYFGEGDTRERQGAVLAQSEEFHNVWFYGAPQSITNEYLAYEGNAAVILALLGQHKDLYWVMQLEGTAPSNNGDDIGGALPSWLTAAFVSLGLSGLWFAVARARRFGPLVPEPLPSAALMEETTRGRANLYEYNRAYSHAAVILRRHLVWKHAKALALTGEKDPKRIAARFAQAARRDPADVYALLFTRSVTSRNALTTLYRDLSTLEQEITDGTHLRSA